MRSRMTLLSVMRSCSCAPKTRDEQINAEIEKSGAYGNEKGGKDVRRAIKSRAGKAATLERLSMSLSLLGLEVVRAGSGGDVVNIYDKLIEDKAAKQQFAWVWKQEEPDTPQEETKDEPATPKIVHLHGCGTSQTITPRVWSKGMRIQRMDRLKRKRRRGRGRLASNQ